jgi:hypothetical protein
MSCTSSTLRRVSHAADRESSPKNLLAMASTGGVVQPLQHFCDHERRSRLLAVPVVPAPLDPRPRKAKDAAMISFTDWLITALIGVTFTLIGSLKLYGLSKGVVGGADKPFVTQLCGT